MLTDIAVGEGAKDGVGDRVEGDIGIRMADQAVVMRYFNAAQDDMVAGAESMHIEALPDPDLAGRRQAEPMARPDQIGGGGDLEQRLVAVDQGDA